MPLVKFLLFCLLPVLTLSACQRAPDISAVSDHRAAVTLLHYFKGALGRNTKELTRSFNAQSQRYELKLALLDDESFKTSIQANLRTGQPPDMYSNWAGARTAAIVADLEPLDDIWQQAGLDSHFSADLVRLASEYQGHKYMIPLAKFEAVMFFNKRVFDAHKLKPPRTWDEFLAICATLKAKGVTPIALGAKDRWPTQFWFDMLLLRSTPLKFRTQLMQGQVRYDDPRVAAVFARWAHLLEKGYFNADANALGWYKGANEMVFNGTAAMTLMGSWNIDYFSVAPHQWVVGQDYDFFTFPRIHDDLPQVVLGSIDGLVLPRKAINKQGAKAVMTYLADAQQQQVFTRSSGTLAPNMQVPREAYDQVRQRLFDDFSRSQDFVFCYDLSTPHAVAELGLNAFSEFVAFPKTYPRILNQLAREADAYFQANPQP